MSPSLPKAGVKIADRVYLGGSPIGESSAELFDHFDHNISPYYLSKSIKIIFPEFYCLLISREVGLTCILKSYYLFSLSETKLSLSSTVSDWEQQFYAYFFRIKSHRVKLNMYIVSVLLSILFFIQSFLRSKSTGVSSDTSYIVAMCIVAGWNHDIFIAKCKGIAIGIVQVAGSSCVSSRIVGELRHHIGRWISLSTSKTSVLCRRSSQSIHRQDIHQYGSLSWCWCLQLLHWWCNWRS